MKKKVISAICIIIVAIPLLLIGGLPFYIGLAILSMLAYKEIVTLKVAHHKVPDLMKVVGAFLLFYLVFNHLKGYYLNIGISYTSICALIVCMLIPSIFYKNDTYTTTDAFYLIGSILLIGVVFNSAILVYNSNKWYLVYLILITAMNDSFAMILGRLIGKHKLIPSVSPNKTVEGSLCGLIIGTFISVIFFINVIKAPINIAVVILMTLILGVVGQLGDLLFSKIKRENNIKDFSKVIPGHGGILDRLDSLILTLLVFVIIINLI